MNETNIVIFDRDVDYCRRLDGALRERLPYAVSVHDFTDEEIFSAYRDPESILLVSESFTDRIKPKEYQYVIILTEGVGSDIEGDNVRKVNKYHRISELIGQINELVMDSPSFPGVLSVGTAVRAKLTGFFSPLTRCLQTTSALTLGQLYAQRGDTLFLSFEPFSGIPRAYGDGGDLTDLLYFHDCEPAKLAFHISRIRVRAGALDIIYPADSFRTIQDTECSKWRELLEEVAVSAGYSRIVCDLSVCMRGLFDVLREFDRICMIERTDPVSAEKLKQFERTLKRTGYEDLAGSIRKLELPVFSRLPADLACYGSGPLAAYLEEMLEEDMDDRS
ncbi:MAG: hypothetical protein K6C95_08400 [Lachnospiraceae bacterium]|nr:hypothetical protein [Lachnospiraceae bacterium]